MITTDHFNYGIYEICLHHNQNRSRIIPRLRVCKKGTFFVDAQTQNDSELTNVKTSL